MHTVELLQEAMEAARRLGYEVRQDWLGGDTATIADIACFPFTALAGESGFEMQPYPQVRAWLARFRQLDGFVEIARPQR